MVRLFGHHVALPVAFLAVCELCLFFLSLVLALWIYPTFARAHFNLELIGRWWIVGLAATNLACLFAAGLYKRDAIRIGSRLSLHLATATSLSVIAFATYLLPYSWIYGYRFSSLFAITLLAVSIQLMLIFFIRAFFVNIVDVVGFKRRLLLLGEGSLAAKVQTWLAENERGYTDVVRRDAVARQDRVVPLRGRLAHSAAVAASAVSLPDRALPEFVRYHSIDEIVVTGSEDHDGSVWDLLECRTSGVKVVDFLTFWERETGRIDLDAIDPNWLVYSGGFRSSLLRRVAQRSLDVLVSIVGLVITSPLLPIVALLIKLDSPGPILYRQERVGKNGHMFQILKFRSMHADAEQGTPRWAEHADPRVTRIGGILRRTRIDELPQLLNVIKGDMSLVGPRPERPAFVAAFERQIPFYDVRHSVRPGITGWAQINYEYAASLEDTKRKLEYDLFYVKNHSVFLDLAIMLQTLRIILWQQGAR